MRRGSLLVPPHAGKIPSFTSGSPICARRRVGHHAPVAADGQLAAAAEAGAVDRGDGDLRQLRELGEDLLPEAHVRLGLLGDR